VKKDKDPKQVGAVPAWTCEASDIDLGDVAVITWTNKDEDTVDITLHRCTGDTPEESPPLILHVDPCVASVLGQLITEASHVMHGDPVPSEDKETGGPWWHGLTTEQFEEISAALQDKE
jgi:hypothetical protein